MSNAVARGQISFHQAEKGEDTFYLRLSPSLLAMSNKRTADDITNQREWWRKYRTSLRLMRGDTNVSGAISRVCIYNESGALVFDSSLDHQTSTADITFSGLYNQATDAATGADKSAWILSFMKFDTPAPCEGQFQIYVDASIPAEEGSTARIPFFDYITLTYTVDDLDTLWGLEYLREATSNGTVTQEGGLILSNAIALGEWENDTFIPWAGMSGIYDEGYVFQGKTLPGKSIAAWYGGDMIDYENLTAAERKTERYAQSLFRMDGSGYLAGGGISWDDDGNLVIAGGVKMTDSQGRQVSVGSVTDLSGLFELKNVGTEQNPVWAIHALNNYPIYSDSWISALGAGSGSSGGGGGGADLPAVWESLINNVAPYANEKINPHHLNIPVSQGTGTYVTGVSWDTTAGILYVTRAAKPSYAFSEITGTATASQLPNIESLTNFSTRVYDATVSRTKNFVLAAPSTANGAATFRALVASDIPDLSSTYQTKYGFTISGTAGKTYDLSKFVTSSGITSVTKGTATSGGAVTTSGGAVTIQFPTAYSLPLAASGTRGGIQIGYSANGKNYPVQLSSEKAYVNVPWTDTTYSAGTGLALNGTTFSINSTYQGYISNGNTAYGWGNHANAGYLYAPRMAYNYTNGFLVETDIATDLSAMFIFIIEGNSYDGNKAPVSSRVQGYNYTTNDQIIAVTAVNLGGVGLDSYSVFCYNGHVCLWFKQLRTYETFHVFCYTQVDRQNHATSITNSAIPTSGVTRKVDVTPMNLYAPYHSAGYLPLSGGTMTGNIYRRMTVDTSNYVDSIIWTDTTNVAIARFGYHNTTQRIYINPIAAADPWSDAVGKYSLVVGKNFLTYNTYTIWHAGNSNLSTVDWTARDFTASRNITGYGNISMGSLSETSTASRYMYLWKHNSSGQALRGMITETDDGLTLSHWNATTGSGYTTLTIGVGVISTSGSVKLSGTSKRIYFGDTYYIELDSDNQLHTNAPFYSDSWVSALGAGSGSGGGGGGSTDLSSVWASLSGHTDAYKDTTIDWAHIKVSRSDLGSGNVVSEVSLTTASDGKSATLTVTKTNMTEFSTVYEKDVTITI